MRRPFLVATLVAVLADAAPALADLEVAVGNGTRVVGRIAPADEAEVFDFTLPRGALLSLTLKGGKGKGAAPATMHLFGPDGNELAAQAIKVVGTGAKLAKFVVASTGLHKIVVRGDGAREVGYQLTFGWKPAPKYPIPADLPSAGLTVPLAVEAGSTLSLAVKAARGSAAVPRLLTLVPVHGGTTIQVPLPADAAAKSQKATVVVPTTDDFELSVSASDGVAGRISGSVTVRPPKPVKSTLALGDSALAGLPFEISRPLVGVLGAAGGALNVDSPLELISGSGVSVPVGALRASTAVVISAATNVPPATAGTTGTGPSVFFGPEGTAFKTAVTVTIPFDPTRFGGNFTTLSVVVRDAAGALAVVPGPYTIDAARGTVSFATSHFSSYRAFGPPAKSAFDLDADGFDDAVYAAPASGPGLVRIRFGNAQRNFFTGRVNHVFASTLGERFGFATATGDVNGDGIADLVVGAPLAIPSGYVSVFFGGPGFDTRSNTADAVITNDATQGNFGTSVAVGDVTGDGIGDVIVGDPIADTQAGGSGLVYVFPGSTSFTSTDPTDSNTILFEGDNDLDRFGAAVAAGRIDGDAVADLVVSAPRELQGGAGRVFLFHGGPSLGSQTAATADVTITSEQPGDAFGAALAVGDASGDGMDDIVVGSPRFDDFSADNGRVSEFNGRAGLSSRTANQSDRQITQFPEPGRQFGRSLRVGNVIGDRTADILMGAPLASGEIGMSMVIVGGPPGVTPHAPTVFGANRAGDHFGVMLGIFDFDGDGLGDMLIARPGPGPNLDGGGSVDLYFGPRAFSRLEANDVGSPGQHLGGEPNTDGLAH